MSDYNMAQAVVSLGYNGNYKVRNLHFQIKCSDREDFLECVDIIGRYNSFSRDTVDNILKMIATKEELLNIGYIIGREGSPVVYLEIWDKDKREAILKELGDGDKYQIDKVDEMGWLIRLWFD